MSLAKILQQIYQNVPTCNCIYLSSALLLQIVLISWEFTSAKRKTEINLKTLSVLLMILPQRPHWKSSSVNYYQLLSRSGLFNSQSNIIKNRKWRRRSLRIYWSVSTFDIRSLGHNWRHKRLVADTREFRHPNRAFQSFHNSHSRSKSVGNTLPGSQHPLQSRIDRNNSQTPERLSVLGCPQS